MDEALDQCLNSSTTMPFAICETLGKLFDLLKDILDGACQSGDDMAEVTGVLISQSEVRS
jgi:hypothetical protein